MESKKQLQKIIVFIADNPGATCPEIIKGTGILRQCVSSALSKLRNRRAVKREGPLSKYRYTVTSIGEAYIESETFVSDLPDFEFTETFGCHNPLTAFINQRLSAVRNCRPVQ